MAPAAAQVGPQQTIADLVTANHILFDQGVVDGFGHISVRNPNNPDRFFLSRARAPSEIEAADIMELDFDGNTLRKRDDGRYELEQHVGRCTDCGDAIPFDRLQHQPQALHCLGCQAAAEAHHALEVGGAQLADFGDASDVFNTVGVAEAQIFV